MTAAKLQKYFIEQSSLSIWEQSESKDTDKDIDKRTLKQFVESAVAAGRLPEDAKADGALLRHLGLLNKHKLNNAGAVLFSKKTTVWVQMAIFATDEKLTFIDMASDEDNILNILDKAERYILKNIHWKAVISGMEREEIPEIPIAVIREALANSFAHAIYNSGTKHEICIHPNMITIYNPGPYASTYSPEEYIRGNIPSSIRNELIAKTLYLNKSIEKFGSGFKRMHSLCTDAGIAFSYEKYDIGFKVVLHRNKGTNNVTLNVLENVTLSPTEKTVYLLVSQNPRATKAEIADKISKTDRTVQRALDSLKEKGFIERAGAKKTGYWIIK